MDEEIEPSAVSYHSEYVKSVKVWLALRNQACQSPTLPHCAVALADAFPHHPRLRPDVKIEYIKYPRHGRAYASGVSEWGSSPSDCEHGMPSFDQKVEMTIVAKDPIHVRIDQSEHENSHHNVWFSPEKGSYISILILAWAYVLSARWAELMSRESSMAYTNSKASTLENSEQRSGQTSPTTIFIGTCSIQETRWWAAVMAPERGWQAKMVIQDDELLAPWSVSLEGSSSFCISGQKNGPLLSDPMQSRAASSAEAIGFLEKFCHLHGLHDQNSAALSAALLLPSRRRSPSLTLPALNISISEPINLFSDKKSASSQKAQLGREIKEQSYARMPGNHDLDRLLTLSCNIKGVYSLLSGVFFEPSVQSNKAGPWLQGALQVAEPLVTSEPCVLGCMLMYRLPEVAPLWLGAVILGLQQEYIQKVGYGQIMVDLNTAAWSGAILSFIQEPVAHRSDRDARMSRADECRLLFLSQVEGHSRTPVSQWAPFGTTVIEQLDLEVRAHQSCRGHALQYKGFHWACIGNESIREEFTLPLIANAPRHSSSSVFNEVELDLPSIQELGQSKMFISRAATQSIFMWLRQDGYALGEKPIWSHEWLDIGESDEEEDEGDDTESRTKSLGHVLRWIQNVEE